MEYLTYSIAELCQGRTNRYTIGNSPGNESKTVIVFERVYLCVGQWMGVSLFSGVSSKVLRCWDSYNVVCDLEHHHHEPTVNVALV